MYDSADKKPPSSSGKNTLFESLLKTAATGIRQQIPCRKSEGPVPLSFSQQRMWILNQLAFESPAYNVIRAFRLKGPLHINILKQCFEEIIRRHEILRTRFSTKDGEPVQVIKPEASFHLSTTDLRHIPETEQESRVGQLLTEESRQLFDLRQGPLLRVTLLQLREEEYVLLLVLHHIIADGWSISLFFRELAALYKAFLRGAPSPLPELPIQYADFTVWQREWLKGNTSDKQLSYWKQQLSGSPPMLALPADRPRPPIQSFQGAHQWFLLSKKTTNALKLLSVREDVTLFMTLLTTFNILLYRYTGQEDILVSSPIANRRQSDVEALIGIFVNTLVLRAKMSGNSTYRDLLQQIRQTCLEAYAHQDMPFEKVVEELKPEYNQSHSPVFQVMFALQNFPPLPLQFDTVTLTLLDVDNKTSKFDLALNMIERKDGLHGIFEYNTNLFETATIKRMIGHFHILLEGILADPDQTITLLSILTDAEKHQILVEWNNTQADYPRDTCIHQLFEDQVERAPDAIAVVFEEQQLTYRELNARANQLAHSLKARGIGPEVRVGLCVERSLEMVVGILGILKAGGAYVPLDPAYPKERRRFILEESGMLVLLTQRKFRIEWSEQPLHTVFLDTERDVISRERNKNLTVAIEPENLAYVLYTSGSTGTPKGTFIEHRSLVNYLKWAGEFLLNDDVHSVPVVTALTFDASLKQIFGILLRGKTVWLLSDEKVASPYAVRQALETRTQVGLNCIPSFWEAILNAINADEQNGQGLSLSSLMVGGEAFSQELADRTFALLPHLRLINLYGPTEATANASALTLVPGEPVSIGRPIANTRLYILDPHFQLVPIGIPGELYIGGAGLARGYSNHPDLTAESFVPNPFSEQPGERLYRTGDLARYLPDGNIEFLGRVDHQVKLRGFRIELGEIETVLRQHPAVREAVVLVREDVPNDKRLVAYVVSEHPSNSRQDFREFLQQKLPDYMIPVVFVFLDALPLTPNGKIDRKALPGPTPKDIAGDSDFVAPRTPIEEALVEIWQRILNLPHVGIHDNFFALGGHSLLAIQLIARIDRELGVELSLREILDMPTIAELAVGIVSRQIESLDDDELAELLDQLE